jgi:cytochrome b
MITGLMLLIAGMGVTGGMTGSDQFWAEPRIEDLHETIANTTLGAAILHVPAAGVESDRPKENMPWPMVTGYKRPASGSDVDNAPATC